MPYSPYKEEARIRIRKLQSLLKQKEKEFERKIETYDTGCETILEESRTYALEEIYKEADKMYDAYITQYYRYKTKVYIRHGEPGVGTKHGSNLFLAKEFDINYDRFGIDINHFEPDNMEGYPWATQEEVFDIVSGGHRGIPGAGKKRYKSWKYTYKGKYYNSEEKTIKEAFDDFESNFDVLYKSIRNSEFFDKYYKLKNKIFGG